MEYIGNVLSENRGLVLGAVTGLTSAGLMWLSRAYEILDCPVPLDKQSVEIKDGVRVYATRRDEKLISYTFEDAQTLFGAFCRGKRVSYSGNFLGTRSGPDGEYAWISYQEAYDQAQQIGSAFMQLGLKPGDETFIGIFSQNRPEWVISKEGSSMFSMVYVPLYDTLGPEACSYVINLTGMQFVLCDNKSKVNALLSNAKDTPTLRFIIVFDGLDEVDLKTAHARNIKVMTFEETLFLGKKTLHDPVPPKPESLAAICFTSGTTGNPKGVMLTHENLIANTAAVNYMLPDGTDINCHDVHISYLPLAHMFEGVVQVMMTQHGGSIGFFRGDVRELTNDMMVLKPTVFPTVPRLLNRIYDKVLMGVQNSKIKSFLFKLALKKKTDLLKDGVFTRGSIWDRLVFHKIQTLLGGRVRFCIVGSAPLSANVLTFARCALGCLVCEGYGQTEATAGISMTLANECEAGQVGPPLPCNRVKLLDVPEMDYYAKDGKGEVCVQGTNVMTGYYKEPEKTKEALEDGWLHTGDIGMWTPSGTIKIIDRRKHIFKLAQGEYLAPEKIEGVYVRSPLVAQAFVDGDSLQTYAVGVMVPDPEVVPGWAEEKLGLKGSMEEICKSDELKKAILEDVTKLGKTAGLKGFEQVKDIHLFPELFSIDNGFLTPTFKSKRPTLRKFFAQHIEDMYNKASS